MNGKVEFQKRKILKKITKNRLKNIGLYYLERFESSVQNLKDVLKRRVDKYAFENSDFNKQEAYAWIEEILSEFQRLGYLSDERYADIKVKNYLAAGKSARYIKTKLKVKGIDEARTDALIENEEYDPKSFALRLAKKRKIGPFRANEKERKENRQKDMGILLRAGFDYDVVCDVLELDVIEGDL